MRELHLHQCSEEMLWVGVLKNGKIGAQIFMLMHSNQMQLQKEPGRYNVVWMNTTGFGPVMSSK